MPRERVMSQNLRDFMDLWRRFNQAKANGENLDEWRRHMIAGLRVLFPPLPDTDPRLWKRCQACEDTGYEFLTRYPTIYGGKTPIRVAVPCRCAKGEQMRVVIANAEERARERRQGVKKTGWTRA